MMPQLEFIPINPPRITIQEEAFQPSYPPETLDNATNVSIAFHSDSNPKIPSTISASSPSKPNFLMINDLYDRLLLIHIFIKSNIGYPLLFSINIILLIISRLLTFEFLLSYWILYGFYRLSSLFLETLPRSMTSTEFRPSLHNNNNTGSIMISSTTGNGVVPFRRNSNRRRLYYNLNINSIAEGSANENSQVQQQPQQQQQHQQQLPQPNQVNSEDQVQNITEQINNLSQNIEIASRLGIEILNNIREFNEETLSLEELYYFVVMNQNSGGLNSTSNSNNRQRGLKPEDIQRLPIKKFYVSSQEDNNFKIETCTICLMNYQNEEELKFLPCFHNYHPMCIDDWLKINDKCPMCKKNVFINNSETNS